MVNERRDENSCDDRQWAPKPRGEEDREQLGLVADFRQGDDPGGGEKRFHEQADRKNRGWFNPILAIRKHERPMATAQLSTTKPSRPIAQFVRAFARAAATAVGGAP